MNRATHPNNAGRNRGFTLIEVLVSVVVLSFGLLGLSMTQIQGLRLNQDASLRTEATLLAYNIIDQMRIERDSIRADNETMTPTQVLAQVGTRFSSSYSAAASGDSCDSGSAATAAVILCWRVKIRDRLPSGTFTITGPSGTNSDQFTLAATWNDRSADQQGTATSSSQNLAFLL